MFSQMPDVTPIQALGIIALVFLGVAKSQGWIDQDTFNWLVGATLGKVGADATIRVGRNVNAAAKANQAAAQLISVPPDGRDSKVQTTP